jgi:hypothetical protein
MQYALGVFMHGFFATAVWVMESLGVTVRMMRNVYPKRHAQLLKKNPFTGYVPGPQDVFVMTDAKSGTNWMMQIVLQLIHHGKAEYDHVHDLVHWPDTMAAPPFMRRYAIPLDQADDWKTAPERKRVIKTHFNWELLPYSPEARYIAVIRDPKDVFVSGYHFIKDGLMGPAMPSPSTWYKLYLSNGFMVGGSWAANAAGYWAERSRPNVLVLSFKDMKRDLRATVEKVARFLDINVSTEVIDEVCRKSSFTYMKQIDHKFAMGKMIPWQKPGAMLRKGTQGGSSEMLTPEQQREVDTYFIAELKRLGSDLPYEDFADRAS